MNQIAQPSSPFRTFIEIIGLAVLYFVTARIGQQLAIPPGNVTPVWLPSGIILAAVLIRGNAVWPGIWLGAFAGNVWAYLDWDEFSNLGVSLVSGTMNGIGDTLCAVVGAHLILKSTQTTRPFNSSSQVFRFILYGALVGGAISAVLGVTGLSLVGFIPWSEYTYVWLTWWVGDAVGVLLLTPILLMARQWISQGIFNAIDYRELAVFVIALVVFVGLALDLMPEISLPIPLFMVLPVLLWGVFRFPTPVPVFAVVAVATTAIIATAAGSGPFVDDDVNASFIALQLFLSTVMSTIFILVGMLEERRLFQVGVEQSEQRYQRLFDQAAGGILLVDENGCIESFNEKAGEIFGYESSEVIGRNVNYLVPSDVKDSHQRYFEHYENYKDREIFGQGMSAVGRHKDGREVPVFLAVNATTNNGRRSFLAVVHDTSEQAKNETELKASEEKFRLLASSSFEALIILTKNSVVSVNDAFQNMFGYEASDIVGKPIKQKLFATDLVFMEGQGGIVRSEGIKKHGIRFPVDVQQKTELIHGEELKIIAVRDRTDFQQQEVALKEAREQADNAKRSKSRFLSAMSHELRSPINSIVGFSQLLETNLDGLDEQQTVSVKEISDASKHLIGLIDDVMDLSKIEAGKFVVNMGRVELDGIVCDCVELIKPLADKRGIKIFNHAEGGPKHFVKADDFRLKQVLLNLFSNAVKYNHADGTVSVGIEVISNTRLKISVTDSGVGVADADLDKIFEPFERVYSDAGNVKGTGIGLVITKSLVELMGGAIGVESYKYVGSTFWVELALSESEEQIPRESEPEVQNLDSKAKKILYIEDEPENLRLVDQVVKKLLDAELLAAGNGALGIEIARKERPDVILMDVDLPGMDGYQVAYELSQFKETESIPVVGISANAQQEQVEKALSHGFSNYIAKPIDMGVLMQTLEGVFEKANRQEH